MKIQELIRRVVEARAPKLPFVRVAGFLGMFVGIAISGYVFNASLLSLAIGTVAGYYVGERLAVVLRKVDPERFTITDRVGIWAVRTVSLVGGLGSVTVGAQLLAPIRSPWEFDRISGAGFFLVGGLVLMMIAFGKLASKWPRLTTALLTPVAVVVFVASLVAFVQRQRLFFLLIGLFVASGLLAWLGGMRKHPGWPVDEGAWYVLSGRLPPPQQRS